MEQIEFLILKNLIHNEKYLRKSIPFIKSEYFEDPHQKMVYEEIFSFVEKYNELPTKEVLTIAIESNNAKYIALSLHHFSVVSTNHSFSTGLSSRQLIK